MHISRVVLNFHQEICFSFFDKGKICFFLKQQRSILVDIDSIQISETCVWVLLPMCEMNFIDVIDEKYGSIFRRFFESS